ncbi:IgG-binding virulence factor TspB family protein, partial [Neisseria sp. HMSC066H01]|uniref:IgG-binding virulence factor TspB family protein n=1 Tax=Neisseria sp. HMSC066H01 TaxID=1715031 RepID=UPI0024B0A7FB
MAVILLGFNFKVHAELVVESNGRVRVSTGGFNQNGVRTWRYLDNGRGGMGGNMFYHENSSKSLAVRDVSTGFRSASTVPVTLEAQVSRKAVLSGAFNLVKRGAALGTRLSGWGTAAYFAYEAYQAVKSDLEFEGYKWNEVSE